MGQTNVISTQDKAKSVAHESGVGKKPKAVPNSVDRTLASSGTPLDSSTRSLMETRFGHDFGGVRVHTGPAAADSAKALNARAYTSGQNIAFDDGEYRPHSAAGRVLLAHELAHTIQQLGFSPNSAALTIDGGVNDQTEREADTAAIAAMRGVRPRIRPGVGGNQLSRADRKWSPDLLTASLSQDAGVAGVTKPFTDEGGDTAQAFDVGVFRLPGEKGYDPKVLQLWQERVTNGALESTITGGEPDKLLLKQERPETEKLRQIWITKLGTDEDALIDAWNALAKRPTDKQGPLKNEFRPIVPGASATAHMDHIVELQLGGNNTPENLQVLDAQENMASGRTIYNALQSQAQSIKKVLGSAAPSRIVVHYSKLEPGSYKFTEPSAYTIANKIESNPPKALKDSFDQWEDFEITAGTSTTLKLPPGTAAAKKAKPVALRGDDAAPVNQAASTLVPGMLLQEFRPHAGGHTIGATFDNEKGSKSRIPFETPADAELTFTVGKDGTLKLRRPSKTVKFYYPYLSEITLKTIEMKADGVAGTATLTPSIKLIKEVEVEFAPNHLAIVTGIDQKKIDPGIPGLRITDAAILIDLYPDFKPSGRVSFELGPAKKAFVDGFIEARLGDAGFEAEGKLNAHVPGLDDATGDVFYKKQTGGAYGWNGFVDLTSSKIPRTKKVAVHAGFDPAGWSVSGTISIAIPGKDQENDADLTVKKQGDNWLFTGDATWKPPVAAIDPVQLHLTYNISQDKLSGWGQTGLTFKGLHGTITVNYDEGAVWGEGKINFKKGKATGTLNVKLSRAHKFSGDGTLTYDVTPKLTVTGKIKVDENEEVLIEGLLEYREPIPLFPRIKGDKNLLTFEQNIPVPGLSLGPSVGLELKLTAALDAGFTINPAELNDVKVGGKLKPFDPNPDPSIYAHAVFISSAEAHITGTLGAGLALSILIAEVSGNLGVSATAQLDASVKAPVDLKYEQEKFSADLAFEAKLALAIILALKAWVIAKAGIGPFSVSTRWDWTLASYTYRPAFAQATLLLKKPLHYDSDNGFTVPGWADFDFKGPQLDPSDVITSLFKNANEKKVED
jgi:hypothetical protein